jgi:hypothetical protein
MHTYICEHINVSALVGAAHINVSALLGSINKSRHNLSAHKYTMRLAYFKNLNHNTITLLLPSDEFNQMLKIEVLAGARRESFLDAVGARVAATAATLEHINFFE